MYRNLFNNLLLIFLLLPFLCTQNIHNMYSYFLVMKRGKKVKEKNLQKQNIQQVDLQKRKKKKRRDQKGGTI